jgi:hypothetical protein
MIGMDAMTMGERADQVGVERAARAARANRDAVRGLGFAHGLAWAAGASQGRLAAAAAGERAAVLPEVAAVQQAAREQGLPGCAMSAEAGFRAAIEAVWARIGELERAG